jgi:hypothetical protein
MNVKSALSFVILLGTVSGQQPPPPRDPAIGLPPRSIFDEPEPVIGSPLGSPHCRPVLSGHKKRPNQPF